MYRAPDQRKIVRRHHAAVHSALRSAHVLSQTKGQLPISSTVNHTCLTRSREPGYVGCTKMRRQTWSITRDLQENGKDASVHVLC